MLALWMLRALSAGGLGVIGWQLGLFISESSTDKAEFIPWGLGLTLAGAIIGGILVPYLILKLWRMSAEYIDSLSGSALISGTVGLLVGLVVASLVHTPLLTIQLAQLGRAGRRECYLRPFRTWAGGPTGAGCARHIPWSGSPCQAR